MVIVDLVYAFHCLVCCSVSSNDILSTLSNCRAGQGSLVWKEPEGIAVETQPHPDAKGRTERK